MNAKNNRCGSCHVETNESNWFVGIASILAVLGSNLALWAKEEAMEFLVSCVVLEGDRYTVVSVPISQLDPKKVEWICSSHRVAWATCDEMNGKEEE